VQEGNAEWLNTELTRDAWTSLIDSGANTLVGVVVGAAIFVVARKTGQQRSGQPEAGQP
jgi:ABC-type branched-subunit amino acid transport system permease subunit